MRLMIAILVALSVNVEAKENDARLLHAFVYDGTVTGYLYGVDNEGVMSGYKMMEVRDNDANEFNVLYKITRTALYDSEGELTAKIHDDGSHGFYLSVQRPTYVVIGCCKIREPHNGAMDDITIEWNPIEQRFQLLRRP